MPNRDVHVALGLGCGLLATTGAVAMRRQRAEPHPADPLHDILHVLGGALGGAVGGRLPDLIEPAIHPNHRGPAHSLLAASGAGGIALLDLVREFEDRCRQAAITCRAQRVAAQDAARETHGLRGVVHAVHASALLVLELWLATLAGVPIGLAAGYVSHLLADGLTPKSIPLLGLRI